MSNIDLPSPLTPADCDLRDFAFMPLDVARLRDSDLAALETPEACWAALLLWSASWHQVPAASLPDDDRVLAKTAGYGRVVKEWLLVREGALHGWVKCADGRLYHPVVAEKALESWHAKAMHHWKKECDRIRKSNKQREQEGKPLLSFPAEPTFKSIDLPKETTGIPAERNHISNGNSENSSGKAEESNGGEFLSMGHAGPIFDSDVGGRRQKEGPGTSNHDSTAVPLENEGIPLEMHANSTGKSDSSTGIPLENALKGQGEGQGQGEGEYIKTKSLFVAPQVVAQPQEPAEKPRRPRNVEISILLRAAGIKPMTSVHPLAVEWAANEAVTDDLLTGAVDMARQAKGEGAVISPNYLKPIVEQLLNPPEPKAKPPVDSWWTSNAGIDRKAAELGMRGYGNQGYPELRDRIFVELQKRKGGKAA